MLEPIIPESAPPVKAQLGPIDPAWLTPDGIARILAGLWFHADREGAWAVAALDATLQMEHLSSRGRWAVQVQEAPPVKPDLDRLWASARRALDSFLRAELAADAAWDRYKAGNLDAPPDFDAWQQIATNRDRTSMEWDRALVNYRRAFQQESEG